MNSRQLTVWVVSGFVATVSNLWAQNLYWGGGITDVADNTSFPTNTSSFCAHGM